MDIGTASAIAAIGGSILTLIFTKGVDAWVKYRQQHHTECEYEDEQVVKGYEFVIATLKESNAKLETERKQEIDSLRRELAKVSLEHLDCVKVQEGLKVLSSQQQAELTRLRTEFDKLSGQMEKRA